jgi:hypothetical protein
MKNICYKLIISDVMARDTVILQEHTVNMLEIEINLKV